MTRTCFATVLMFAWASLAEAQAPGTQPPPIVRGNTAPSPTTRPTPISPPATAVPPPPRTNTAPTAPQADPQSARSHGAMISLSVGATGCTYYHCMELEPLVYVRLGVLYRLHSHLAAGIHLSFNFFRYDQDAETSINTWQVFAAPEFRALLPVGGLDLWTGLAPGFIRFMLKVEDPYISYKSWAYGFGLGWGMGLQYHLLARFAVGAEFWLYVPVFTRSCTDYVGAAQPCFDVERQESNAITWSVGLSATYWWGK